MSNRFSPSWSALKEGEQNLRLSIAAALMEAIYNFRTFCIGKKPSMWIYTCTTHPNSKTHYLVVWMTNKMFDSVNEMLKRGCEPYASDGILGSVRGCGLCISSFILALFGNEEFYLASKLPDGKFAVTRGFPTGKYSDWDSEVVTDAKAPRVGADMIKDWLGPQVLEAGSVGYVFPFPRKGEQKSDSGGGVLNTSTMNMLSRLLGPLGDEFNLDATYGRGTLLGPGMKFLSMSNFKTNAGSGQHREKYHSLSAFYHRYGLADKPFEIVGKNIITRRKTQDATIRTSVDVRMKFYLFPGFLDVQNRLKNVRNHPTNDGGYSRGGASDPGSAPPKSTEEFPLFVLRAPCLADLGQESEGDDTGQRLRTAPLYWFNPISHLMSLLRCNYSGVDKLRYEDKGEWKPDADLFTHKRKPFVYIDLVIEHVNWTKIADADGEVEMDLSSYRVDDVIAKILGTHLPENFKFANGSITVKPIVEQIFTQVSDRNGAAVEKLRKICHVLFPIEVDDLLPIPVGDKKKGKSKPSLEVRGSLLSKKNKQKPGMSLRVVKEHSVYQVKFFEQDGTEVNPSGSPSRKWDLTRI